MRTPYGDIPDRFVPDMTPQDMHDYLRKHFGRRTLLKGAGVGAAAVGSTMFWQQGWANASTQTAPQWIAYGADPTSTMHISWSAGSASATPSPYPSAPIVRWGLDTSYGQTQSAAGHTVPVPANPPYTPNSGDADATVYLSTQLTGLAPGTTYHYGVSNDNGVTWSADATFTTARSTSAPFRWIGTGDQNSTVGVSDNIEKTMASFSPDFAVVAGDLSYASGGVLLPAGGGAQPAYTPGLWDSYLGQMGPNIGQSVPWMVGVGNHEMEPLDNHGYAGFTTRFPQAYDLSAGSPVVSTFTYGNVAFIQLDANDLSAEIANNNGYTAGAQTDWLTAKLQAYRASGSGIDFIVVSFHNCMFCSNQTHGSDGAVRNVWEPIFDTYQVDLVLNGHVHAYERSHPMKAGQPTKTVLSGGTVSPAVDGTTYICAGGGGQSLYTTWYGTTGGGDAGSATLPKVYDFPTESKTGGSGTVTRNQDTSLNFSAYRKANWSFIVVDVTPATVAGGTTTMAIRAIDPSQTSSAVNPANPPVMDSVTLTRTSTVTPPPALPEAGHAALLVATGAGLATAGAYLTNRRRRAATGTAEDLAL